MSDKSKEFADWLEGGSASTDEDLQRMQQMASQLMSSAHNYQQQEVPNWDRGATFQQEKQPWWQWQGLPAMSFATSMLALVMVLLKVEVSVSNDSFMVSFAGKQQREQVEQLVEKRLQGFSNDQMLVLANYAEDLQNQQKLANADLIRHVLSSSRLERKEDFGELVKFLQQQREDDQYSVSRQLASIKKQAGMTPANYQITDQE